MPSNKEIKTKLTDWGLLDPRFARQGDPRKRVEHTNNWHPLCDSALKVFLRLFDKEPVVNESAYDFALSKGEPPAFSPGTAKEKALIRAYETHNWFVARGNDVYNVIWIEDAERNWETKRGSLGAWDDIAVVWQAEHNGTVRIVEEFYQVTTEPGRFYTSRPVNINGAARIEIPGQYKAWIRGLHGSGRTAHQGFRQELPIRVRRDLDKNGIRTGDRIQDGVFYCNWHSTTNTPIKIGKWSAGCSVFRFMSEFHKFMKCLEQDRRYKNAPGYAFIGSYIGADELGM